MGSEFDDEWIGAASLWMVSMRTGELAATAARAKLTTDLILDDGRPSRYSRYRDNRDEIDYDKLQRVLGRQV